MNKNMCHGALQNILKIYIGQSRKSCYQLLRMDAKQARLVLGLRPGEDWRDHQLAFMAARDGMANLVRSAPTESLSQRYQEGLMEFDKALAFFREQEAAERLAEREMMHLAEADPPYEQPTSSALDEEVTTEKISTKKSGKSSVLVWLTVLLFFGGCGYFAYQQWLRYEDRKSQLQCAEWESQAADHVSKRQWNDALNLYDQIELAKPNSPIVVKGKRSIEAGMLEEQEQYIGYWTGEAQSAFEAMRWDDSKAAIAKVLEKIPVNNEMLALREKIALMQSEGERTRLLNVARDAMRQRNWQQALDSIELILKVNPQQQDAITLKQEVESGRKLQVEQTAKAQLLFDKAKSRHKGVFDQQVLTWMTEAKLLAPDQAEIESFYQVVASYARTLRVPAEFLTINAAVAAAKANDRIVLDKGDYKGPFQIDLAVTIEAKFGDVILSCAADQGAVMTFGPNAQGIRVDGVIFKHSSFDHALERFPAVQARGAAVTFSQCVFREAAGHGLAVMEGAVIEIKQCRFEANGWDGLSVFDAQTKAHIIDSVSTGNFEQGIDVWKNATAILENNRCEENSRNGILIDSNAVISIKGNTLRGNREYGLVLRQSGKGEINNNRIVANAMGGIVIAAKAGDAVVNENQLEANQGPGFMLEKGVEEKKYQDNTIAVPEGGKKILGGVVME